MYKNIACAINRQKYVIISFCFAFSLMVWLLRSSHSMGVGRGGDVTDIWKTITSFYSGNIQPSYVLYKGFLSIYPYVWFYELSKFFGLNSWFFIKLFHCFLFSYISAVGFPYIISKLLKIEIKFWRRILVIFLMFILWKPNHALQDMMIDLWSLTLFILAVSIALKLLENKIKTFTCVSFFAGLVLGTASLGSGQYFLPVVILIVALLINLFSKENIKNVSKKFILIIYAIMMVVGVMVPKAYDVHFEKTVVDPMREDGANIIPSKVWLDIGLGLAKRRYNLFWEPTIPNHRSLSIIKQDKGDDYESFIQNEMIYSKRELIDLIRKHPVDFVTSWCNGLFLTVSMHGEHRSILCLLISYTALFLSLYAVFKRCKKLKDIFSVKLLIVLSFISVTIAPCINHLELRYVMAFQGLFLSAAFLDHIIWNGIKNFLLWIKSLFSRTASMNLKNINIPYSFVIYVLFIIMCFSNYAALIENVGVDPSILFSWIY